MIESSVASELLSKINERRVLEFVQWNGPAQVIDQKEDDVGPTEFSFCHGSLRAEDLCYEQCDCSSRKDSFDRYSHYFLS
jgi:hypothetical protein|tara:strand:- start:2861 stop:3100 length:240 start_codon:yes stop_codon:yes gene_type:complete